MFHVNRTELRVSAEASDLGLAPGYTPSRLLVDGFVEPFEFMDYGYDREGELTHYKYVSGVWELTLWND